jgi:hypothetical protein
VDYPGNSVRREGPERVRADEPFLPDKPVEGLSCDGTRQATGAKVNRTPFHLIRAVRVILPISHPGASASADTADLLLYVVHEQISGLARPHINPQETQGPFAEEDHPLLSLAGDPDSATREVNVLNPDFDDFIDSTAGCI